MLQAAMSDLQRIAVLNTMAIRVSEIDVDTIEWEEFVNATRKCGGPPSELFSWRVQEGFRKDSNNAPDQPHPLAQEITQRD